MTRTAAVNRLIIGFIITVGILLSGGATGSAANRGEQHCVVEVDADGSGSLLRTAAETCFATKTGVEAYLRSTAARGTTTIGRHYTGTDFTGSTVTISGTVCSGGVWKPTGFWNNNIESSSHFCGTAPTTFYNNSGCSSGAHAISTATVSLGSANNTASCVRYG